MTKDFFSFIHGYNDSLDTSFIVEIINEFISDSITFQNFDYECFLSPSSKSVPLVKSSFVKQSLVHVLSWSSDIYDYFGR